ncbi:MAG TPA: CheR family methyltransferase [Azonexus sp.]|nr:CheR family methyltransferase [Azonexus sp.]
MNMLYAPPPISDLEFGHIRQLLHEVAGIELAPSKKTLVSGRLFQRLNKFQLDSYQDYIQLISSPEHSAELQTAIDLLTTNETRFFREPKHFDFVHDRVIHDARPARPYRIWSAACSSGEEAYSLAMVLADRLGERWEIVASDISHRMLERATKGLYPLPQASTIPPPYLSRYCLKGIGRRTGTFAVHSRLREAIRFEQINLNRPLPPQQEFDMIFLRNVMIYFDATTKSEVMAHLLPQLRHGGYFVIGHAENLYGMTAGLQRVAPSIYRKLSQ